MKKFIVVAFILMTVPVFAGELVIKNKKDVPVIIEVNNIKTELNAGQTKNVRYSGLSVTVKLYDKEGKFILEKKIDTPDRKAMATIGTGEDGSEYYMNLVPNYY